MIRSDEWEDPAKRGAFLQQRARRGYVIAPDTIPAEQWVEEYRPGGLIDQWLGGPDQRHDVGPGAVNADGLTFKRWKGRRAYS